MFEVFIVMNWTEQQLLNCIQSIDHSVPAIAAYPATKGNYTVITQFNIQTENNEWVEMMLGKKAHFNFNAL